MEVLDTFQDFMTSNDFLDFNDYYTISRNNKYTFSCNKFDTTVDYFLHMNKHINKSNLLEKKLDFQKIFEKHDFEFITNCNINTCYTDNEDTYSSDRSDLVENYDNIKLTINEYEDEEYDENIEKTTTPKFKTFMTKTDPEICSPAFFMFNNLYNDVEDEHIYKDDDINEDELDINENRSEESDSDELLY